LSGLGRLTQSREGTSGIAKNVSPDWLVASQIAKARPDPSNVSRKQTEIKRDDKGFSDEDGREL